MATYIPPKMVLPVSKGADLIVDFPQKVDDTYTDYAANVVVRLEVDCGGATISSVAEISSFHAVCRIESTAADTIAAGSLWRCVVSYPTVHYTTEVVPVNGTISRHDGN
jgi:hypothetical protein